MEQALQKIIVQQKFFGLHRTPSFVIYVTTFSETAQKRTLSVKRREGGTIYIIIMIRRATNAPAIAFGAVSKVSFL